MATLQRWVEFGGTWTLLHRTDTTVIISLRRCDGGEEVERLSSADPDLIAYLDRAPTVEG